MVLAACIVLVQLSRLLPAAIAAQIHDLNITDLVLCDGKGGGADGAPTIVWSPSIVVSKQNVTLAVAQAQWKQGRNLVKAEGVISRSADGGLNFSPDRVSLPGGAQLLASRLTNTIHAFGVAVPNASATALTRAISTDDGETWSTPVVLEDPFIVGEGGLNHGVELQRGPHRGRFLLPYAKASTSSDKYAAHALTLYSDTHGANWSIGALLPDYSGEAAITELANGSVLISFRNEGEHMPRHPHNRGFARSDDGGATWAEVWYANDRDPAIIDAPSDQGIDRSEKTGALYFGHPGAVDGDRANYTIHRSTDSGATFEFVGVIYPGGAGYSDVHVLPSYDGPGDRLGVAFQRCLNDSTREGGGYNLAWASMTVTP